MTYIDTSCVNARAEKQTINYNNKKFRKEIGEKNRKMKNAYKEIYAIRLHRIFSSTGIVIFKLVLHYFKCRRFTRVALNRKLVCGWPLINFRKVSFLHVSLR